MLKQKNNSGQSFLQKNIFIVSLVVVLLFGAFLRFYHLGRIPVSLYWDEAAMLVDAKAIAESGRDMHGNRWLQAMFPSYGDYKLPVYIWLASVAVQFFGVSSFALRLPSAVVGVVHLGVIGLLAWQIIGRDTRQSKQIFAIAVKLVMAITPWSILFSRTGFEGQLGQFFLTLSVLFMYFSQRKYRDNGVLLPLMCFMSATIFGAIAVYAYYSVRFVWPVVLLGFFFFQSFDGFSWKRIFRFNALQLLKKGMLAVLCLVVWFVLLLPLTKSPHYQASQTFRLSTDSILKTETEIIQSNVYRETAGNGPLSRVLYHRHWLVGRELLKNYVAHVDLEYLFVSGDSNLRHGTGRVGVFQLWMLPLFILGLYGLARKHWRVFGFLMVWWMAALLPASVPTTVPHALRSLNALTPLALMIGFGASMAVEWVWNRKRQIVPLSLGIIGAAVVTIGSVLFLHDYFHHYPTRSAFDWQDGYQQLAQLLMDEKDAVRTVWVNPSDDRLYLWLMAFGRFSGSEFAQWQSLNYKFTAIDNIVFEAYDWGRLDTIDHKLIIVEKPGALQKQPYRVEQIKDACGAVRFEVGWYQEHWLNPKE